MINNRLQSFPEKYDKIKECQAGFRKNFSTVDHIFALHVLVSLSQRNRKKLFCGFIDLKRAFDSVWRSGLLFKIKQFNITGKCFNVIKIMYDNIKYCVSLNGVMSNFFESNNGVRQGENLSPFHFAVFLNDLESFLSSNAELQGVDFVTNAANNMIYMYLKNICLIIR